MHTYVLYTHTGVLCIHRHTHTHCAHTWESRVTYVYTQPGL